MLCRNPFVRDRSGKIFVKARISDLPRELQAELMLKGVPFPCGQCLPCRINRRRIWTLRLILEYYANSPACFITLTYRPECLPPGGTLVKRDVQLFIKRLRKMFEPRKIRYFAVGEYGTQTYRAHYHAIIFGLSRSDLAPVLVQLWPFGLNHIGDFSTDSAQYVAGYVVKKFVHKGDQSGLLPEFILSSRRPGLGFDSVSHIVESFNIPALKAQEEAGRPAKTINVGSRSYPLGRYLRNKIRESLGVDDEKTLITMVDDFADLFFAHRGSGADCRDVPFVDYLTAIDDGKVNALKWWQRNKRDRDLI